MRELKLACALLFVSQNELMATDWLPETLYKTKRDGPGGSPPSNPEPELGRVHCYAQLFAGSLTSEHRFEGDGSHTFNKPLSLPSLLR